LFIASTLRQLAVGLPHDYAEFGVSIFRNAADWLIIGHTLHVIKAKRVYSEKQSIKSSDEVFGLLRAS